MNNYSAKLSVFGMTTCKKCGKLHAVDQPGCRDHDDRERTFYRVVERPEWTKKRKPIIFSEKSSPECNKQHPIGVISSKAEFGSWVMTNGRDDRDYRRVSRAADLDITYCDYHTLESGMALENYWYLIRNIKVAK